MSRARVVWALLAVTAVGACTTSPGPADPSRTPGPSGTGGLPGAAGVGDPYYPEDGNGGYDVLGYDVAIRYDPSSDEFGGDTTVTAVASADLSRFNLDLIGFQVGAVEIDGKPAKFARAGVHELVITPPATVTKGATFRTRVTYSGTPEGEDDPSTDGDGWRKARSGGVFVAGQPHSASTWFPVNDHPSDKATFRLTARVPDGWSVIGNGREEPPYSADGWTTYTWVEANRIAPYLTTVGIDHWTFDRSTYHGLPLVSAYAPGVEFQRATEARLPEVLDFLASKFGPYPQDAAGGIFINEDIGFAVELQTRPIYGTEDDLGIVVHEQAHQWFGNSVSLNRWSDICLNECFASYAEWLWDEAKNDTDLDETYRQAVAKADDAFWNRPLLDMGPGKEFTAVYDKGKLAMHALRRTLGEAKFDQLLTRWTSEHRDGNANWADLEKLVNDIAGQDQTAFLTEWFHKAAKPSDRFLYPGSLRE
ncbi:M1 family metallopeptidase [Actinokineospora auranticolor]|uniref:Aminopeptidase N n=1 Tax=Actinokineospora auranticolor TaxID=155976 RepID=A0A2S6GLK7_9PSEU|nr:M1 family metallopeptidase [Actinokineospora auranticolor]PPK66046.1 peptidase M1-like protein [Actinokineospora auranticolor]